MIKKMEKGKGDTQENPVEKCKEAEFTLHKLFFGKVFLFKCNGNLTVVLV